MGEMLGWVFLGMLLISPLFLIHAIGQVVGHKIRTMLDPAYKERDEHLGRGTPYRLPRKLHWIESFVTLAYKGHGPKSFLKFWAIPTFVASLLALVSFAVYQIVDKVA